MIEAKKEPRNVEIADNILEMTLLDTNSTTPPKSLGSPQKDIQDLWDIVELSLAQAKSQALEINITMYLENLGLEIKTDPSKKQQLYRQKQMQTELYPTPPPKAVGLIEFSPKECSLLQLRKKKSCQQQ